MITITLRILVYFRHFSGLSGAERGFIMKKHAFTCLCCSFFVFCLMIMISGAQEKEKGSPSIIFPDPRYEFEAVFEGVDVVHDFVVKNTGTAALNIQKASGG